MDEDFAENDPRYVKALREMLELSGLPEAPTRDDVEQLRGQIVRHRWSEGSENLCDPRPLERLLSGGQSPVEQRPAARDVVEYSYDVRNTLMCVRLLADDMPTHEEWLVDGKWWGYEYYDSKALLLQCWWVKESPEGIVESYHRRSVFRKSWDEFYTYDDHGRVIQVRLDSGGYSTVTYDVDGEVASVIRDDGAIKYKRPSGRPKRTLRKALRTRFTQALVRGAKEHAGSPLWAIYVMTEGEVIVLAAFVTVAERDEWLKEPAEDRALEWLWNPVVRGDEDEARGSDWMGFEGVKDPDVEEFETLWKETVDTWFGGEDDDADPDTELVNLLRKAAKDATAELKGSPTVAEDFFIVIGFAREEDRFPEAVRAAVGRRRAKKMADAHMLHDGEEYMREHFGDLVDDE